MHRRSFLISATGTLLATARRLHADHHVISADPLIVVFDLDTLQGRYTRVEDFYVRNHYDTPVISGPAALRLEAEGETPKDLSLDQLKALPETDVGAVLECAGDPVRAISLVSDGMWRGWRLSEVISLAHPRSGWSYLHLVGKDGFSRSIPMNRAMSDGWLVTTLNGRPLLPEHGAPWRALFPGWYGMDSVKWVQKLVFASEPLPPVGNAYLEIRRDSSGSLSALPLPPVQVKSVMTSPLNGSVIHRGKVQARGVAWSGSGQIQSVQVSADGGTTWEPATLDRSASRYDWTLWNVSLDLTRPGVVELTSKAIDSIGNTQPEKWYPDRADLYAYNVCGQIRCVVI
jgi:DMSO/TMAO reductase YedYZ molybdopterin-dependent catalytic subunit